jgi:hypothetical protein
VVGAVGVVEEVSRRSIRLIPVVVEVKVKVQVKVKVVEVVVKGYMRRLVQYVDFLQYYS